MNKVRRKSIQDVASQLETLKSELEGLQGEEEEYRDNIPENLQGSARYEAADEACDTLGEAADGLGDIITSLDELSEG